jgi:threonine dehydratase
VLEYGAEVVDCENHERASVCEREMQKARQAGKEVVYFPSYDHVDVIEGHGSIMLEVEEQAKKIWGEKGRPDVVVCPIGGGGLISGVSLAAKGVYGAEGVAIVGVEPEGGCLTACVLDVAASQANSMTSFSQGLMTRTARSSQAFGNLLYIRRVQSVTVS